MPGKAITDYAFGELVFAQGQLKRSDNREHLLKQTTCEQKLTKNPQPAIY